LPIAHGRPTFHHTLALHARHISTPTYFSLLLPLRRRHRRPEKLPVVHLSSTRLIASNRPPSHHRTTSRPKSTNHGVYSGSSPHGTTKYPTTSGLGVATTEQERRPIVKSRRDEDSPGVGRRTSLYQHEHACRRDSRYSSDSDFHTTCDRDQHLRGCDRRRLPVCETRTSCCVKSRRNRGDWAVDRYTSREPRQHQRAGAGDNAASH
jgi:hypothetical protein